VRRRDWRLRVTDVLAAVERIGRYTVGLDRAAFERDERTVEAVCFALVVIGEAASHVPDEVQATAPQIPWRKMKAMRNIAAHEYFGLDLATVWQTATVDVPAQHPVRVEVPTRAACRERHRLARSVEHVAYAGRVLRPQTAPRR
jgi:uncharacterized protein with HEPN domain